MSFFLFEKGEIFFGEPFLSAKQKKGFKKKILKIVLLIEQYIADLYSENTDSCIRNIINVTL